jgi:hypothetical protein
MTDRPTGEPAPPADRRTGRSSASWWIPVLIVIFVLVVGWVWGWGTWFGTEPSNGTGGQAIVTSTPMGNTTAQNGTVTGKAPPSGPPPSSINGEPANTAPPHPLPDSENNKP